MKKLIFSLIIFLVLLEVQGFTLINRNNKAVQAIKDTLLYRAETELKAGLEKSPDDPILNYNYGLVNLRRFEEQGDVSGLETAIESFEKAKVDTTESNLQATYYNQANAYYNSQDYSNAIHNYQYSGTYLDSTNVDPDLLYNYANSIYKFAETNPEYDSLYTMAEDIYKSTSGLVDSSHKQKIWHNLGNSAFQQQKYQEAIGYYVQALTLDPSSEDTRINYEIALRKLAEQQSQQQENQENQENNQEQKDKQEQSEENQEKSENQQQQEQKQEEEAQEKQDQYDELSDEEKEKLEAEKKLDALLQQQSRPEQDDEKPTIREQRPSGRYW
jgi:tetratricopeptide (TPR) repeat protein